MRDRKSCVLFFIFFIYAGNLVLGTSLVQNVTAFTVLKGDNLTVQGTYTLAPVSYFLGWGTLRANQVINNGVIEIGAAGGILDQNQEVGPSTLTIQGDYIQSSSGELWVDLAGDGTCDGLTITGSAQVAGRLWMRWLDQLPLAAQNYQVISAGSLSGTFDRVQLPTGQWVVSYIGSDLMALWLGN